MCLFVLQAGTFSIASEDVLKNRPIKKAKRRTAAGEVGKMELYRLLEHFVGRRKLTSRTAHDVQGLEKQGELQHSAH